MEALKARIEALEALNRDLAWEARMEGEKAHKEACELSRKLGSAEAKARINAGALRIAEAQISDLTAARDVLRANIDKLECSLPAAECGRDDSAYGADAASAFAIPSDWNKRFPPK